MVLKQWTLVLLSDEPDLRVAADDFDPRGWIVVDATGAERGQVTDLVVTIETMKVAYMVVRTIDGRRVLLPAGVARLHPTTRQVIFDLLTPELLDELPDFERLPLSADDDARIHRAFTGRDPIRPDHAASPDRRRHTRRSA